MRAIRFRFSRPIGVVVAVLLVCSASAASTAGAQRAVGATRLAVYLVRGEHVAPVRRVVPQTTAVARAALTSLLRGPTAPERRAGYRSAAPAGTVLRGVTVARGVATVDLSRRYEAGGGSLSMLLRVAQVVHTATQFTSVERVVFRLDGRPVEAIGGEGVVVAPAVSRAAFEDEAPPILVERPLPGDVVAAPIEVSGTADVFEARLVVEAVGPDGRVLARRSVLASAGTGTRGAFATRLVLSASVRRATVVAYARSARDGARMHVARVPVVVASHR